MMNAKRSANVNLTRYAFLVPAVLICLFTISLSKAELVKKSKMAYKTIAANVKKLVVVTDVPVAKKLIDTVRTDTPDKETAAVTYRATPDTDKTAKRSQKTDSATIYINGIKSTDADLSRLIPNTIATFNVTKGKDGGVIFVTTKKDGSTTETTGNATINGNKNLNEVTIVGYRVNGKTVPLNKVQVNTGAVITIPVNPIPTNNMTFTYGKKPDAVGGDVSTTNMLSNLNENKPLKEVTVTGYKVDDATGANIANIVQARAITKFDMDHHPSYKFEVATVPMRSYTDFTGKLIFIDGKEASKETQENLPASKIESITVNNSRDMIEEYGDKAAKGVIFIITKKADK